MKLGKKINKMEKVRKIKYSNKNQRGIIKKYIYQGARDHKRENGEIQKLRDLRKKKYQDSLDKDM